LHSLCAKPISFSALGQFISLQQKDKHNIIDEKARSIKWETLGKMFKKSIDYLNIDIHATFLYLYSDKNWSPFISKTLIAKALAILIYKL
jgi:UDP-galactopyranose mutase